MGRSTSWSCPGGYPISNTSGGNRGARGFSSGSDPFDRFDLVRSYYPLSRIRRDVGRVVPERVEPGGRHNHRDKDSVLTKPGPSRSPGTPDVCGLCQHPRIRLNNALIAPGATRSSDTELRNVRFGLRLAVR